VALRRADLTGNKDRLPTSGVHRSKRSSVANERAMKPAKLRLAPFAVAADSELIKLEIHREPRYCC